ncbi:MULTISPECIES: enoyl-CoA hydratase-related protein [unclassified Sulfitobacter]|uniref:enoyl-CoA hydratase-related protein n=1 Tax=unclassified Sulfitobacter TaxID=196795 RepID=UPI0007C3259A|nr:MULTISPECIES: enoyl-CoA hydratase-related protein [unclassified Sulfitobacter]KZY02687.1 enoyl-CoA hydratase [Sulfitobacter sp. HI0023]KZY26718.1 enoyl-CoA hydratase [Sulfitobacter sp. HI0040]KZZ69554.1 enoyl-CoA hydratase [Sulfitobacter sp. HI0129]
MSYEFIKTERQGHILIVTMNRPDVYNAVHVDMHNEMADCWDSFAADQDLWVAVLTGAGDKAFSAGNDLKATAQGGSKAKMTESGFAGLSSRFDLEKPIIAAVNGFAMGGGFETALSCDIILASENAKFALPEVKVGFFAAASGVQRLSRYVGRLAAQEMMFTGRTITAAEALEMGCVNEVHPHDELLAKALEKAEQLCTVSPSAVKATKRVLNDLNRRDGMVESIAYSREVIADLSKTEDFKEGVNAFVEKRAPQWVNK